MAFARGIFQYPHTERADGKIRIVLVDDCFQILDSLERLFVRWGVRGPDTHAREPLRALPVLLEQAAESS